MTTTSSILAGVLLLAVAARWWRRHQLRRATAVADALIARNAARWVSDDQGNPMNYPDAETIALVGRRNTLQFLLAERRVRRNQLRLVPRARKEA